MHRSRLTSSDATKRHRLRTPLALFTGLLLAVGTPATVAGAQPAAAGPAAAEGQFQQVPLAKGEPETGEPMSLAVLPDRSVLHTSRDGTLRLTDQGGVTKVAGRLDVYSHDEEGLQGVGVDPDFENNRAIYLYYAPPLDTPAGDAPETGTAEDFKKFDGVNRLSRFTVTGDTIDLASEKKILEVPAYRDRTFPEPGHTGGAVEFGPDGTLSAMGPAALDRIDGHAEPVFIPLQRADTPASAALRAALSRAHVEGVAVDWAAGGHDGGDRETGRVEDRVGAWFDRWLKRDASVDTGPAFRVSRTGGVDSTDGRATLRAATADRGAASGLYLASYFLGGLVGSAVLGQLFDRFGWAAAVAGVGVALLAAALLAMLNAVPWSGEVRMIGSPSVRLTPSWKCKALNGASA